MATAYEILRQIVVIGMLPKSKVRADLIAAYVDNDDGICSNQLLRFLPREFETGCELLASDVEKLPLDERVAFLKGASLLLGDRLRARVHCICNMPPAVILPVAAFASILQEDFDMARKTWKTFANIPRYCAEKLRIEREEGEEFVDLRKLTFDQFITKITGSPRDLSEVELGRLAAERIEKAFELERYRKRN